MLQEPKQWEKTLLVGCRTKQRQRSLYRAFLLCFLHSPATARLQHRAEHVSIALSHSNLVHICSYHQEKFRRKGCKQPPCAMHALSQLHSYYNAKPPFVYHFTPNCLRISKSLGKKRQEAISDPKRLEQSSCCLHFGHSYFCEPFHLYLTPCFAIQPRSRGVLPSSNTWRPNM